MGEKKNAIDIGVHGFAKVLAVHRSHYNDACIVDKDVEAAKVSFDLLRCRRNRVVLVYIELEETECSLRLAGLNLLDGLFPFGRGTGAENDMVVGRGCGESSACVEANAIIAAC